MLDAQGQLAQDIGRTEQQSPALNNRYYGLLEKTRKLIPFIIEFVNKNGTTISLLNGNGKERILGLRLSINPSTISMNMSKIINRSQTMTGWVEEHWGEELDTITFQGSSVAFVIGGRSTYDTVKTRIINEVGNNDISSFYKYMGIDLKEENVFKESKYIGLTTSKRRESLSYKEFKNFVEILKDNGVTFGDDGFVNDRAFIKLSYDYVAYKGFFESLDVTEDANSPFRFTYTVTFKAESTLYNFRH